MAVDAAFSREGPPLNISGRYTGRSPTFSNWQRFGFPAPLQLEIVHSLFIILSATQYASKENIRDQAAARTKYPFPFPIPSLSTLIAYREPSQRHTEEPEARSSPEEHSIAICTLSQCLGRQFHSAQTPPRAHRSPPKPDRTPAA